MKLEVKNVCFAYDSLPIIKDLSISISQGEFVSLIGPSGSGKSTLFYLIGGLMKPAQGDIAWKGQSIVGQRGNFAYMPQQPSLFPWRTVTENISLPGELQHRKIAAEQVQIYLKKAGLTDAGNRYPHELSGGMQQRVAFLRTLASGQDWLLLDEPFGALDALTRTHMQKWLHTLLKQEQRTILFITHSIEEALLLSDRIYVLTDRPMQVYKEITVPFSQTSRFSLRGSKKWETLRKQLEDWLLPDTAFMN
ncbi:ABC transporter ATP-binding protein [Thermoactinomyces mirandus]|uniref:ABC transporter ATP-binding protein n=1 Tax=Thermoactinomyces mirandus TaxID=2756294 RepID=A0A7W2AS44_9BACL|nr:ABC transporter ATP-binding protein [Thermoactinomyces mirandus]MBA4603052.1 ABC transporter ATP-binding protein [Thermoactinomyces mirandus]